MIKMIKKYFSLEQRQKRKKLRQLGNEIATTQDYDELVKLVIDTPKTLNEIERECYQKIQANRSVNPRAALDNFKGI